MVEFFQALSLLIKEKIKGTRFEHFNSYIEVIILLVFIIVLPFAIKQIVTLAKFLKVRRAYSEKLYPYFTKDEVKSATDLYINTRCQSIPPNNELEPADNFGFAISKELIPFTSVALFYIIVL